MIRFPSPLRPGDLIAVTAPSSGVSDGALPRLDLVLDHLRRQGFRVVEGECLRAQRKDASAPAPMRAAELDAFLRDDQVKAVMPPWGGELATEVLDRLDFETLAEFEPKWFVGFSDLSTLHLPLTLLSGWATAHGPNLMDLAPTQNDPLTQAAMSVLRSDFHKPVRQRSSTRYQTAWTPFEERFDAAFNLSEPTRWRRLDGGSGPLQFRGRLIGGCIDTIAWLAGTRYGEVPGFVQRTGQEGVILYLENVEMTPAAFLRALTALRRHGWFEGLTGLLIGRHAAADAVGPDGLSFSDALHAVMGPLRFPVLCDVDIGHRPPQFTLINGAMAQVSFEAGAGSLDQARCAAALL